MARILALLAALASVAQLASAKTTFTVNWNTSFGKQTQVAAPGDVIDFKFGPAHNVWSHASDTDFESCRASTQLARTGSSGFQFTVPETATSGDSYYFSCQTTGHCRNMRLEVLVGNTRLFRAEKQQ